MEEIKEKIRITDTFWKKYRDLIVDKVLPYQWEVMNDELDITITHEPEGNSETQRASHAIQNLKIAAGKAAGKHHGYPFQDTDVYKWLEAAAYSLKYSPDQDLKKITDALIDLIASAQDSDGYLVTYFQIEAPNRKFARLKQSHELYTMGHYIEAAVAYNEVTNNHKALEIAENMADLLVTRFGPNEGQLPGYDGHPEIEIALAKLYEVTLKKEYLDLAEFFILERGKSDFWNDQFQIDGANQDILEGMEALPLSYFQADRPITEQMTAEGHAVRVIYLCAGMAQVSKISGNQELLTSCQRLWKNIVNKKMYITGGVGSTNIGESFTGNYDLPNDTMYCETCASVGMAFFAKEMLWLDSQGEYGDVLERELYNCIISGISLDGTHFFYVNPLQVTPEVSKHNPSRKHVLAHRADWFGCACCPSNVARLIASVQDYIYTEKENTVLIHQYIANEAQLTNNVSISVKGNYPWDGKIQLTIVNPNGSKIGLRIPNWSQNNYKVSIDGRQVWLPLEEGFIYLEKLRAETQIILQLDMAIKRYQSNDKVQYNTGKVAVQRGPLVYCVEEMDQNTDVWKYQLPVDSKFTYHFDSQLLDGIGYIESSAEIPVNSPQKQLYKEYQPISWESTTLTLVPYYAWGNREIGQMQVWINQK